MEREGNLRPLHIGISVADLEQSVQWYHDMLDFELISKVTLEHIRCDIAVMRQKGSGFELELFRHWDSISVPKERLDPDEDMITQGTKHICFYVDGLEKKVARLRAAGVTIVCGPGKMDPYTFYYIQDPSGVLIELAEIL